MTPEVRPALSDWMQAGSGINRSKDYKKAEQAKLTEASVKWKEREMLEAWNYLGPMLTASRVRHNRVTQGRPDQGVFA